MFELLKAMARQAIADSGGNLRDGASVESMWRECSCRICARYAQLMAQCPVSPGARTYRFRLDGQNGWRVCGPGIGFRGFRMLDWRTYMDDGSAYSNIFEALA